VTTDELGAGSAKEPAQHESQQDGVVELAGYGDEVWNQIDRHRQVGDQRDEEELGRTRNPGISDQAAT